MTEHKIHFLGEKDYIPVMESQNRLWREQHVKNGKITTRDGIRLNYYYAEHPQPKAVVVILHGYCGFWGKYHEFAWYLWQAGYTIFFLEQRCHGLCEGPARIDGPGGHACFRGSPPSPAGPLHGRRCRRSLPRNPAKIFPRSSPHFSYAQTPYRKDDSPQDRSFADLHEDDPQPEKAVFWTTSL